MGRLIQCIGVLLAGVGVWALLLVDELPSSFWNALDELAASVGRGVWALLVLTVMFLAPGGIAFLGGSLLRIRMAQSERGVGGQVLRVALTMVLAILTVWLSLYLMARLNIWGGRSLYDQCDAPNICLLT